MLQRRLPPFSDLRAFLRLLTERDDLVQIEAPVSLRHEITEIHRRVVAQDGPALLFRNPLHDDGTPARMPVLVNLFGSVRRVAAGLGREASDLPAFGEMLADMREPRPPRNLADTFGKLGLARAALAMRPTHGRRAPVREHILRQPDVDLTRLPVQTHWPGEPAPLITWPLVITRHPDDQRAEAVNVGVYRMQVLGRDRAIIRWLAHRGGAAHHRAWQARGTPMPVAVAIGADPATLLAAAMPLPETLSELHFAGMLGGRRPQLAEGVSVPLPVPANAEIVIEGHVDPQEIADEGPYGDHTGYYNAVEPFPVLRVSAITMRQKPIYVSTFTGRPPDEPSRIGEAFNALYAPMVRRQFPEITDFWLPPEACSYRIAVVAMDKRYPGHARRLMLGLWSILPQFTYTKMVIIVDSDIDPRDWASVMWAVSTRSDPSRDLVNLSDTPIDYLDFASPKPGLGGKLGIDATHKMPPETSREWGRVIVPDPEVVARIDALWVELGITGLSRNAA